MINYETYLNEFSQTVENEVSIDETIYKTQKVNPVKFSNFPRPAKWLNSYSNKYIVPFFFISVLWNYGISQIFFIYEYFKFKKLLKFLIKSEVTSFENMVVGLGFSERAFYVIPKSGTSSVNIWLTFPWVNEINNLNLKCVSIMSLLSKKDLFTALKLSFMSLKKCSSNKTLITWSVHTYTAYKWFIARIALEKIKNIKEVCIAEHFDRWASLAGYWSYENQYTLSMIQHGLVQNESMDFPYRIPNRIINVHKLYTYNKNSERIFKDYIVSAGLDIQCFYFKPLIEVRKISSSEGEKSVLFVGNTLCESFHSDLYKKLKEKLIFKAFYKPHPTVKPSQFIMSLDWEVIDQKDFFPDVDLLISYPSTLVEEYANIGTPSVLHSINADNKDLIMVLKSVQDKLVN